jgi:hypothetical protein
MLDYKSVPTVNSVPVSLQGHSHAASGYDIIIGPGLESSTVLNENQEIIQLDIALKMQRPEAGELVQLSPELVYTVPSDYIYNGFIRPDYISDDPTTVDSPQDLQICCSTSYNTIWWTGCTVWIYDAVNTNWMQDGNLNTFLLKDVDAYSDRDYINSYTGVQPGQTVHVLEDNTYWTWDGNNGYWFQRFQDYNWNPPEETRPYLFGILGETVTIFQNQDNAGSNQGVLQRVYLPQQDLYRGQTDRPVRIMNSGWGTGLAIQFYDVTHFDSDVYLGLFNLVYLSHRSQSLSFMWNPVREAWSIVFDKGSNKGSGDSGFAGAYEELDDDFDGTPSKVRYTLDKSLFHKVQNIPEILVQPAIPNSTASTLESLVSDYNALLETLRTANILTRDA